MENVFSHNMEFIQKSFPHVYNAINNKDKISTDLQAKVVTAKNGLLNIKVNSNDYNIFLHSNYDQEKEIDAVLRNLDLENKDTLIIIGFGMGYLVERVSYLYPNMNKLIFEPNPSIFECVLNHRDVTKILRAKNVEMVIADTADQIVEELKALHQNGRINSLEFLVLPSYMRLNSELIDQTKELFTKYLRLFVVNVNTNLVWKKEWLNNFLSNLKHIPESADLIDLAGKFTDVPAILVSAGPSLSKNIELLREVSDKAVIMASGSTITVLQNAGIKPHIMLGIDGSQEMADLYSKVKWTDVLFAYVLNIHRGCTDYYTGPKVYAKSISEPQVEWMEQFTGHVSPVVFSGGSCANVALDFLKKLGCNPVIFIGQDLAFTNKQYYADGHANKDAVTVDSLDLERLRKTKDIYGNEIYTNDSFLTMAYGFEIYMESHAKDDVYINATEGGLPLKGSEVMTLREAIDKYCSKPADIKITLERLVADSVRQNENLKVQLTGFIKMLSTRSEEISVLSRKRIKLVNKILDDVSKGKLKQTATAGKKLVQLTEELENNELFQKIIGVSIRDVLLVFKNNSEAAANQKTNIKEKLSILYRGLKSQFELIEELNETIGSISSEALERLEIRGVENG